MGAFVICWRGMKFGPCRVRVAPGYVRYMRRRSCSPRKYDSYRKWWLRGGTPVRSGKGEHA